MASAIIPNSGNYFPDYPTSRAGRQDLEFSALRQSRLMKGVKP